GDHQSQCALVYAVQAQLSRFRGDDGRTPAFPSVHHDHALDPALRAGIRKAYRAAKGERPSISFCAPSGTSKPPRRSDGPSGAKGDCRIRSRSIASRPLIARPKRLSANIPREISEIRSSKYLDNLIEQNH